MSFASAQFPFFVAFGLWFYSIFPNERKLWALLLLTLAWYATWNWFWPVAVLAMTAGNYAALKWQERAAFQPRIFFGSLLTINVLILVIAKISGFAPFGFSFFSFMLIAFLLDAWRGALRERPGSFIEYLTAVSFFPMLMGGPIERYNHLGPQLKRLRRLDFDHICDGILVFAFGFLKYYFLSDSLNRLVSQLFENSGFDALLIGGCLRTLQAYVEFSSYCDMGRGVAKCFGIQLLPNFRPIYYAKDPNDFWLRWNITLGTWIRDYVSFPAMLHFGRRVSQYLIIMLAYLVVGLWHGFASNWILFGLFNGALISLYFWLQKTVLLKRPRAVQALGFFLVWVMLVGNGILQDAGAWSLLEKTFHHFLLSDGSIVEILLAQLTPLAPYLAVLAVFDFLQEKKGDIDFYLRFAREARVGGAVAFVCWFIVMLYGGNLLELKPPPPVYFRF